MFIGDVCECDGICCCAEFVQPPVCAWCGGIVGIGGEEDVCADCLAKEAEAQAS